MLESVIQDIDVGLENKPLSNPKTRTGARGIVVKGEYIALFNKANMNEYKLPGGGVEEGEDYAIAFSREVLEETGCIVEDVELLGTVEEKKGHNNFYQKSYAYVGYVVEDTGTLHLTEKEAKEGARLVWVTVDEAIDLITNCKDNIIDSPCDEDETVYSSKFIIKRDLTILNYYKNVYLKGRE